ncbi:MAG: hypothetical protein IIA65_10040, partial [Planctomycetes bacterium]|nr:hypothetical protein [Planctomycetota bacterium]
QEDSNTFQVEMYYDGRIQLAWLEVDASDGLVGLSDGLGVRPGLTEVDFSEGPIQTPALPTLSINDVSQAEGDSGHSEMVFTVSLSATTSQTVHVHYATQAGSASAGTDYLAVHNSLDIAAGQTTALIPVTVLGDTDVEANETFTVLLSDVQGATLGGAVGLGTIENDDMPPIPVPFEHFGGDGDPFDLAYTSIEFTPGSPGDPYDIVRQSIEELPTDPSGGTVLTLSDDDSRRVDLTGGAEVALFGQTFSAFYVGSNGNITFTESDRDFTESEADHLDTLRISALFDDLDPTRGGQVSVRQLADRVVVTWDGISQFAPFGQADSNTFQVEMSFDGRIRLSWLAISATDGLVGLSDGQGLRPGLEEVDLSVL